MTEGTITLGRKKRKGMVHLAVKITLSNVGHCILRGTYGAQVDGEK